MFIEYLLSKWNAIWQHAKICAKHEKGIFLKVLQSS